MAKNEANDPILLPEGRITNMSLFEKEVYTDERGNEGTPKYKVEVAFDEAAAETIDNMLADAAVAKWGAGAADQYWAGDIVSPLIDGNKLAAKRKAKDKPGDAYEGMQIVRAGTIFNGQGQNAPGGIQVYDEDVKAVEAATNIRTDDEGKKTPAIYQGCYARVAVVIGTYTDAKTQQNALMFYLSAVQKTRDGEPLVASRDHSTLFQPAGNTGGSDEKPAGRRKRAG